MLRDFCAARRSRLDALHEAILLAEVEIKETATWLAEPKNSSVEQLIVPISSLITSLEKEQVSHPDEAHCAVPLTHSSLGCGFPG